MALLELSDAFGTVGQEREYEIDRIRSDAVWRDYDGVEEPGACG